MGEHCDDKKERQRTACILCTLLLVGLLILLLILYFSVFKPKDPRVQVPTMQLLSYSTSQLQLVAGEASAASLALNLQVSIYNPNRGDFIIQQGSTACLYFHNQQIGFTPIPPATIPALSFSTTSVSLSTSSPIPLISAAPDDYAFSGGGESSPLDNNNVVLPISTSVTIIGEVTTASLFSHHSDVVSKCKVALSLATPNAYIHSYTCQSSYSLDD